MAGELALVITQEGYLFEGPGDLGGTNGTGLADEIFSGWAVRILEAPQAEDQPQAGADAGPDRWLYIETHYAYKGWMDKNDLRIITREELAARQDKDRFQRICGSSVDLHAEPKVQGTILETLLRNSFVEVLEQNEQGDWTLVRSAAGKQGWIPSVILAPRKEDDAYLLPGTDPETCFFRQADRILEDLDEETLRERVVSAAMAYMGCQYRWGGKGTLGIDCSGLAFMSWMENGVLIYRDADIKPLYPMYEIDRKDLKKGDLIFFPGHVAVSLGGGRFIHATAFAKTPYVTVNSLDRDDPDCREDLIEKVTGCASLWKR